MSNTDLSNWWREAFGPEYGTAFGYFYSPEKTVSEVEFLLRFVGVESGHKILDVPCGVGRHGRVLAERGFQVVGLDFSADLLQRAAEDTKQFGSQVRLVQGDMRDFDLHEKFNCVVTLGNSFGYFDDVGNEDFISSVARHLSSDGLFVLDLPNSAGLLRSPIGQNEFTFPEGRVVTAAHSFDPITMRLGIRWEMQVGDSLRITEGYLRVYVMTEIIALLAKYGFSIKSIYGDFFGAEFNIDTPRAIVVATKD